MTPRSALLALVLLVGSARAGLADGWWGGGDDGETFTCSGEEVGGCDENGCAYYGCKDPDGTDTYTCDARRTTGGRHSASLGSTLAVFGFVGYRLGRKRRPKLAPRRNR